MNFVFMVIFNTYMQFLEHGTESQRKELARQLIGHVLPLSLQMYGCRVIQKVDPYTLFCIIAWSSSRMT